MYYSRDIVCAVKIKNNKKLYYHRDIVCAQYLKLEKHAYKIAIKYGGWYKKYDTK